MFCHCCCCVTVMHVEWIETLSEGRRTRRALLGSRQPYRLARQTLLRLRHSAVSVSLVASHPPRHAKQDWPYARDEGHSSLPRPSDLANACTDGHYELISVDICGMGEAA